MATKQDDPEEFKAELRDPDEEQIEKGGPAAEAPPARSEDPSEMFSHEFGQLGDEIHLTEILLETGKEEKAVLNLWDEMGLLETLVDKIYKAFNVDEHLHKDPDLWTSLHIVTDPKFRLKRLAKLFDQMKHSTDIKLLKEVSHAINQAVKSFPKIIKTLSHSFKADVPSDHPEPKGRYIPQKAVVLEDTLPSGGSESFHSAQKAVVFPPSGESESFHSARTQVSDEKAPEELRKPKHVQIKPDLLKAAPEKYKIVKAWKTEIEELYINSVQGVGKLPAKPEKGELRRWLRNVLLGPIAKYNEKHQTTLVPADFADERYFPGSPKILKELKSHRMLQIFNLLSGVKGTERFVSPALARRSRRGGDVTNNQVDLMKHHMLKMAIFFNNAEFTAGDWMDQFTSRIKDFFLNPSTFGAKVKGIRIPNIAGSLKSTLKTLWAEMRGGEKTERLEEKRRVLKQSLQPKRYAIDNVPDEKRMQVAEQAYPGFEQWFSELLNLKEEDQIYDQLTDFFSVDNVKKMLPRLEGVVQFTKRADRNVALTSIIHFFQKLLIPEKTKLRFKEQPPPLDKDLVNAAVEETVNELGASGQKSKKKRYNAFKKELNEIHEWALTQQDTTYHGVDPRMIAYNDKILRGLRLEEMMWEKFPQEKPFNLIHKEWWIGSTAKIWQLNVETHYLKTRVENGDLNAIPEFNEQAKIWNALPADQRIFDPKQPPMRFTIFKTPGKKPGPSMGAQPKKKQGGVARKHPKWSVKAKAPRPGEKTEQSEHVKRISETRKKRSLALKEEQEIVDERVARGEKKPGARQQWKRSGKVRKVKEEFKEERTKDELNRERAQNEAEQREKDRKRGKKIQKQRLRDLELKRRGNISVVDLDTAYESTRVGGHFGADDYIHESAPDWREHIPSSSDRTEPAEDEASEGIPDERSAAQLHDRAAPRPAREEGHYGEPDLPLEGHHPIERLREENAWADWERQVADPGIRRAIDRGDARMFFAYNDHLPVGQQIQPMFRRRMRAATIHNRPGLVETHWLRPHPLQRVDEDSMLDRLEKEQPLGGISSNAESASISDYISLKLLPATLYIHIKKNVQRAALLILARQLIDHIAHSPTRIMLKQSKKTGKFKYSVWLGSSLLRTITESELLQKFLNATRDRKKAITIIVRQNIQKGNIHRLWERDHSLL